MDAKSAARRWFWPTPAWLVWGAAAATGVLFVCERWRWFPVHYQKGWPVLLAVAVVAAVLVLILAWMLAALVFRRRVQFGLGTLLVFVTLCAVVCSWLAVRIKQARRQADAVAVILQKLDYPVFYDWQLDDNGNSLLNPSPSAPEPLWKMLGVDFFADVEDLPIVQQPMTDSDLTNIALFTRLKSLKLAGDQFTDQGLSKLKVLTNLRELWMEDCNVTDEGRKELQQALPACQIEYLSQGMR